MQLQMQQEEPVWQEYKQSYGVIVLTKIFGYAVIVLCLLIVITSVILIVVYHKDIFGNGSDHVNENTYGEVNPDTWTATDGLGRTLPTAVETGEKKQDKFVGLFYWTWHYSHAQDKPVRDASVYLSEAPEAVRDYDHPIWTGESDGLPHYWGKPLFGYYSNLDEYVVRKHAELIADAGVDVIIFDCTNGTQIWEEGYETLFRVFEESRADGVNVPQVAFMLPFAGSEDAKTSLHNLYNNIYKEGRYKDLWFMWDGKPLIMAHSSALDKKNDDDKVILDFHIQNIGYSNHYVLPTY